MLLLLGGGVVIVVATMADNIRGNNRGSSFWAAYLDLLDIFSNHFYLYGYANSLPFSSLPQFAQVICNRFL